MSDKAVLEECITCQSYLNHQAGIPADGRATCDGRTFCQCKDCDRSGANQPGYCWLRVPVGKPNTLRTLIEQWPERRKVLPEARFPASVFSRVCPSLWAELKATELHHTAMRSSEAMNAALDAHSAKPL